MVIFGKKAYFWVLMVACAVGGMPLAVSAMDRTVTPELALERLSDLRGSPAFAYDKEAERIQGLLVGALENPVTAGAALEAYSRFMDKVAADTVDAHGREKGLEQLTRNLDFVFKRFGNRIKDPRFASGWEFYSNKLQALEGLRKSVPHAKSLREINKLCSDVECCTDELEAYEVAARPDLVEKAFVDLEKRVLEMDSTMRGLVTRLKDALHAKPDFDALQLVCKEILGCNRLLKKGRAKAEVTPVVAPAPVAGPAEPVKRPVQPPASSAKKSVPLAAHDGKAAGADAARPVSAKLSCADQYFREVSRCWGAASVPTIVDCACAEIDDLARWFREGYKVPSGLEAALEAMLSHERAYPGYEAFYHGASGHYAVYLRLAKFLYEKHNHCTLPDDFVPLRRPGSRTDFDAVKKAWSFEFRPGETDHTPAMKEGLLSVSYTPFGNHRGLGENAFGYFLLGQSVHSLDKPICELLAAYGYDVGDEGFHRISCLLARSLHRSTMVQILIRLKMVDDVAYNSTGLGGRDPFRLVTDQTFRQRDICLKKAAQAKDRVSVLSSFDGTQARVLLKPSFFDQPNEAVKIWVHTLFDEEKQREFDQKFEEILRIAKVE